MNGILIEIRDKCYDIRKRLEIDQKNVLKTIDEIEENNKEIEESLTIVRELIDMVKLLKRPLTFKVVDGDRT